MRTAGVVARDTDRRSARVAARMERPGDLLRAHDLAAATAAGAARAQTARAFATRGAAIASNPQPADVLAVDAGVRATAYHHAAWSAADTCPVGIHPRAVSDRSALAGGVKIRRPDLEGPGNAASSGALGVAGSNGGVGAADREVPIAIAYRDTRSVGESHCRRDGTSCARDPAIHG